MRSPAGIDLLPEDFVEALALCTPVERAIIEWRARIIAEFRGKQLAPAGKWYYWLILAGRGWGKTHVGSTDLSFYCATNPEVRGAVIAPTQADVRGTCFEGVSGILAQLPPALRTLAKYNASNLTLDFPWNGSQIRGFSAEKPDRLRGPQFHRAWGDELASWGGGVVRKQDGKLKSRLQDTWDNLLLGLRLGDDPRCILTTTPRPLKFLSELARNKRTALTRGGTMENRANLAATTLELLEDTYAGTRKGRQELDAEILEDVEGALWSAGMLETLRVREHPQLLRVVVAVDPATTANATSDETGIVVEGLGEDGHVYTLADLSGKYSPSKWAEITLAAYDNFQADCIIAETNNGGDLVETNLRAEAKNKFFRYKSITARRGKYIRAEPIAALYEKGRCHHVGTFRQLETQMCEWTGNFTEYSPDRLDAKVYATTELVFGGVQREHF